ncbi:hypothetical protein LC613_22005 [Nostoc sphaeroides CHAB 2801]|uniref:hypothetical protein n=1 Tax=Nostoc sphaeroides TaxID=446679 RepID=UPI000E5221C5|nr:hypothetical protein [Nostoc sphaeroides]MCC5630529.1 hypothetical protein [Nostoc sphaeroides CHAB 2801]
MSIQNINLDFSRKLKKEDRISPFKVGGNNSYLKPRFQPLAGNVDRWAAAASSGGGSLKDGHSQSETGNETI